MAYYAVLARDTVRQLGQYADLDGLVVADVGGGPGYFAREFRAAGARAVCLDTDSGELAGLGRPGTGQRDRQRAAPAARHRRGGRVLLLQRAGARRGLAGDAGRDGAGDPAGRRRLRHASPTGCRPGAGMRPHPGTTSAGTGRPAATSAGTAGRRRTGTAPASTRFPWPPPSPGRGRLRVPCWPTPCPGTCRAGPGRCCGSRCCASSSPGTCCWCCADAAVVC